MDINVFRDISYGLYIISTQYNGKDVGCIVNTLSQVTSENPIISVSINKNNYTNEAIKNSEKFGISIISEKINEEIIYKFGYNSSKDVDKFNGYKYEEVNSVPVITEGVCGYLICELIQVVDCETHDIFIARVVDTKKCSDEKEMTYRYYHEVIKGKAPKNAPTYIEESVNKRDNQEKGKGEFAKYKCIVCGYIYDEEVEQVKFEDLPDDWKCPRCGVDKEIFVKI